MISEEQAAANAANAQLSTGPRTEEGKARSAQNSLKHGCFSRNIILPGESQEEFDAFHQGFINDYRPQGQSESSLVRDLAEIEWRLTRLRRIEAAGIADALDSGDLEPKCLLNYTLIEQRLIRSFQATLKSLEHLQAPRLARLDQDFRAACELRQLALESNMDWQPGYDGFVFSLDEIDQSIHLRKKLEMAAKTVKHRFYPDLGPQSPLKNAA